MLKDIKWLEKIKLYVKRYSTLNKDYEKRRDNRIVHKKLTN